MNNRDSRCLATRRYFHGGLEMHVTVRDSNVDVMFIKGKGELPVRRVSYCGGQLKLANSSGVKSEQVAN
jgi:hypothetical protein